MCKNSHLTLARKVTSFIDGQHNRCYCYTEIDFTLAFLHLHWRLEENRGGPSRPYLSSNGGKEKGREIGELNNWSTA